MVQCFKEQSYCVSSLTEPLLFQFDREHFNEVFVDLKWFESKVGNKYLNEAAGLAAEKEAAIKATVKEVCTFVTYFNPHVRSRET